MGYPFELYCLPRRDQDTLTVVLVDADAVLIRPVVTTVDDVPGSALTCMSLLHLAYDSVFWGSVLPRQPMCLRCHTSRLNGASAGPRFTQIVLGLDACRAIGTGWSISQADEIVRHDLASHPNAVGIDWGHGAGLPAFRSVGSQTTPFIGNGLFAVDIGVITSTQASAWMFF